jgi:hypothetical protein
MGDVISRRRGSLGTGMVEAIMMIRLNKGMIVRDVTHVESLPNSWKEYIPDRPDYPTDYFDESEEEELEGAGVGGGDNLMGEDDDNDSSGSDALRR